MADQSQGNNGTYQLINPPNMLKVKVGDSEGFGIDPEMIRRAEHVLSGLEEEFEDRITIELARLTKLAGDLEADTSKADSIARKTEKICREIQGQGQTYGYELVCDIAASLLGYLSRLEDRGNIKPEVMRAHADALRAVFKNGVKGSGGEVGAALIGSLEKLVARSKR